LSNTPPPLRAGWQASTTSADGSLDCPGDVFERFDFVVAKAIWPDLRWNNPPVMV